MWLDEFVLNSSLICWCMHCSIVLRITVQHAIVNHIPLAVHLRTFHIMSSDQVAFIKYSFIPNILLPYKENKTQPNSTHRLPVLLHSLQLSHVDIIFTRYHSKFPHASFPHMTLFKLVQYYILPLIPSQGMKASHDATCMTLKEILLKLMKCQVEQNSLIKTDNFVSKDAHSQIEVGYCFVYDDHGGGIQVQQAKSVIFGWAANKIYLSTCCMQMY